ncbi:MAG TPA: alanine racemase [Stellaceae bacterium]|nr:alanine racemase [Stellaceae bacterium]
MPSDRKVATDRANAVLEIDLRAVVANWRRLKRKLAPGVSMAAVIKADAYGLGAAQVGPVLARAGCALFFVASLDEGIVLRKILPKARIAILDGTLAGSETEFVRRRLIPVLNDFGQVTRWGKAHPRTPAILHIDTGMQRLGLSRAEVDRLAGDPVLLARLDLAVIMSHLACADEPEHRKNPEQLARFRAALARLPRAPASLASSSAIFLGPEYHFQIVRPGAALFGINPLPGKPNPMCATIALRAKILQVRDVDAGETVGYGATHRMERRSRIATVAVGYADGWLRSASDRGSAAIAGRRVPVVGRISMDLLTLDVTGIGADRAKPGAYVDLVDDSYGIDDAADAARTIGYEMLTLLGHRYARIYRGAR